MKPLSDNRGGTLLSVIVAVVILTIALTMATSSFYSASRLARQSASFTLAGNFTEGVLEKTRSQPFDTIRTTEVATDLPKLPQAHCTVSVTERAAGLKQVTVKCSWLEGKRTRKTEFSTLVAKGGAR